MKREDIIHQILLRAVIEVRDVLLEADNNLELAKLLNIQITIPEPQNHDEFEEPEITTKRTIEHCYI